MLRVYPSRTSEIATKLPAGDYGLRSAFDVVLTLVELCGVALVRSISGTSLLGQGREHRLV